ncbi:crossover junction endodeoxyribonuclease RuvC [Risungbinella massiliensis]|uniref:crossover junction endodeoxyribonuclease RuvC n=1 Tax=Risungbinella massiliensis TaxID=1329796 RepID=UPI0005CC135F|nr:crossover junction endodeoxyribonuclease RuvC [Risungbinella massiliensis]
MRVCGIDPGIAIVGYGFVDVRGNQLSAVDYGSIQTEAGLAVPTRLKQVYDGTKYLLQKYRPDVVAIEKLFFNRNVTTAFTVGQARGVMMLACEEEGIEITEYTPLQVKMSAVGYGKATKRQVQEMVKLLLNLTQIPKPDDVADALAIAICEAHSGEALRKLKGRGVKK